MRDDVPHPEMGESPIVVKYSGQKRFANCFRDFILFLHAPGWPTSWTTSPPQHGRSVGFLRWHYFSLMGWWVDLDRAGWRMHFPVLWSRRLCLVAGLLSSRTYLLLSWMVSRSNSLSARPSVPPGFRNAVPVWFLGVRCTESWQSFRLGRTLKRMKSSLM